MALQVWLPLNGDLHNQGLDNITLSSNTGAVISNSGKIGKCYSFDATNDWIQYSINKNFYSGKAISFACWFKSDQSKASNTLLDLAADLAIGCSYTSSSNIVKFNVWRVYDSNGSRAGDSRVTSNSYDASKWHHIVVVCDATTNQIYVDGILVDTWQSISQTYWVPMLPNTQYNKFSIGKSAGSNNWTGGLINDVRIYDHALSPKEVSEISKGLVLHYKLDNYSRNNLLPYGVELYDYIQSDGNSWIDTEVKGHMNHTYEVEFQQVDSGNYKIWGVFGQTSYAGLNMSITYPNMVRWESTSGGTSGITVGTYGTNKHTIQIKNGLITFDGTNKGTPSGHNTNTVIDYNLFLFTVNPADNTPSANSKAKIYSYKDIDVDGNIIRNMFPCTYFGEPGMWDTVENKFYRNQGTGQFVLGNKITLKEYEYLQSSGGQYIDSGVIPYNNPKLEFTWASTQATNKHHVGNNKSKSGTIIFGRNATKFYYRYYSTSLYYIDETPVINQFYDIILSDKLIINGEVKHTNSNTFISHDNTSLKIFKSDTLQGGECKIKKFKIYEGNLLIRDFIPVSYNGTPGLWDKVEWKFYANAGTGDFTLGNEVNTKVYDCSGYGNDGEFYRYDSTGDITIVSDSPRYEYSTFLNSADVTNADAGTVYIYGHCELTTPPQMTVAFWCKPTVTGYGNYNGQGQFCTTQYAYNTSNVGTDYTVSAMNVRDGTVDINSSPSTTQLRLSFTPILNEWHHYVITYDGQTGRIYKDGVETQNKTYDSVRNLGSFIGVVVGFSKAGGARRRSKSYFSDFRLYATALSEDDIKELYNTSAVVDNNQNIGCFQLEESAEDIVNIMKTGVITCNSITEDNLASIYDDGDITCNQLIEI